MAPFSISEVIRGINAFTLGAQAINPDVKVLVEWAHAWHATNKAKKLSHKLIDAGADVLSQHTDTPTPVEVAQALGVYGIGYHSDMSRFGENSHLESVVHDWANVYGQRVQALADDRWSAKYLCSGLKESASKLAAISSSVPGHVM